MCRAAVENSGYERKQRGFLEIVRAGKGLLRESGFTGMTEKTLHALPIADSGVVSLFLIGEGLSSLDRVFTAIRPWAVRWFEIRALTTLDRMCRPVHDPETIAKRVPGQHPLEITTY